MQMRVTATATSANEMGSRVGRVEEEALTRRITHLERLRRVVPGELLHEELEEEVAVLDEALPHHLVGHLVHGGAVQRDGLVVEQGDDLDEGRAERRGEERLRQVVAALAHHDRLQILVGGVLVH